MVSPYRGHRSGTSEVKGFSLIDPGLEQSTPSLRPLVLILLDEGIGALEQVTVRKRT